MKHEKILRGYRTGHLAERVPTYATKLNLRDKRDNERSAAELHACPHVPLNASPGRSQLAAQTLNLSDILC